MSILRGIQSWFRRKQGTGDLDDELRFHLEKEIEQNITRGMSPVEARRRALISFGGMQQTRERVRQTGSTHLVEVLWHDLRYGWRLLRKSPGFTAVAVTTLALGIGMNTAIFSLIDAVLFRALPANHPEELVLLQWHALHSPKMMNSSSYDDCAARRLTTDNARGCSLSLPFFAGVRAQGLFSDVAAFTRAPALDLSGNGAASIINNGQLVSGSFFALLGTKAAAGRLLQSSDDTSNAPPAVVLSYGYWQSAFGGSRDAVGRTVRLNGTPFTIVGVVEQSFSALSPGHKFDLWLPLAAKHLVEPRWTPEDETERNWWLVIVGRANRGISPSQAQSALTLLFQNATLHTEKPHFAETDAPGIDVLPAQKGLVGNRGEILDPLYLLMMAVGLVLLIACANIAGLLLARSASRTREIAVRLTLGAQRGRLILQLMAESLLLSGIGAALGLLLAQWGARGLLLLADKDGTGPLPFSPQLNWRVLAFTAAVAIFTGVIFGLVPALRSLRVDLTPALKAGTSGSDIGPYPRWYGMGNILVIAQVSLAIVALVTAGLLVRTLRNLKAADLGFDSDHLLVFVLDPTLAGYKGIQVDSLYRDLQEKIAALPGVQSVTYSWTSLLRGWQWGTGIHVPGTPDKEAADVDYLPVGPKFFSTMRIPLKVGRDFNAADFTAAAERSARSPLAKPDPTAPPIPVIVNEAFVRKHYPYVNPLGQHVEEPIPDDPTEPRGSGWEIVGIAGDARYYDLRPEIGPTMYAASAGNASFSVRTSGDPLAMAPAIRNLINLRDSNLAMDGIASQDQQIDQQVFVESLVARLSSFFGLLAVLLACTGIYGLLSYEVTRRTREIGIRMAIGAQQKDVVGMVLRQGLLVALAGAVIGGGASFAVNGLMEKILYHVRVGDPLTLAVVTGILLAIALVACYLPARRATRVDPLVALRYE